MPTILPFRDFLIDPIAWLGNKGKLLWEGIITPSRWKELQIELEQNMRRAGASREQIHAALVELDHAIFSLNQQASAQSPWKQAKPWVLTVMGIIMAGLVVSLLGKLGK